MRHLARYLSLCVRGHLAIRLILAAFFGIATFYNVVNPLFEAPDEIWHYLVSQRLRETWQLPIQTPHRMRAEIVDQQEAAQPPLYYALGAVATFWVPVRSATEWLRPNEHASIGAPLSEDNKNRFVHSSDEDFPYQGDYLAAHIVRLLSTLFGAGTVLMTYLIAREVLPSRNDFAILAASINAFVPQFIYISAAVNNDVPVTFFCSATILLALRVLKRPAGTWRQWLPLGTFAGLAVLTKTTGLATFGLIGATYLLVYLRSRQISVVRSFAGAVCCALLLTSWWFVRNVQLYGELLPLKSLLGRSSLTDEVSSFAEIARDLDGLRLSFWALFGWFSIMVDRMVYVVFDVLTIAALVGLGIAIWRRRQSEMSKAVLLLLALWLAVIALLLLQYRLMVLAFQGRLLFPAISAISILLALGLWHLIVPRFRKGAVFAVVMGIAGIAAWLPFIAIMPWYVPVPSSAKVPSADEIESVAAKFGGSIELLAFESVPDAKPGETVEVTLYWRTGERVAEDYSVFVHLVDSSETVVAQKDTFPGGGRNATSLWKNGEVYADRYRLTLPSNVIAPSLLRLQTGMYIKRTMQRVPWTLAGGGIVNAVELQRVRVIDKVAPGPTQVTANTDLGRKVILAGYNLSERKVAVGGELRGELLFLAQASLGLDYTVFVQVVGPHGVVAQDDKQPRQGAFPTSAWLPGDAVRHSFDIRIPDSAPTGRFSLIAGLYDLKSGERLAAGRQDYADLGTVEIVD